MHCLITRIALIFSVGFLVCSHAKAQDCGPWLNVGAWQVTFSITGMGSGKPTASGGSQYTWTISQNGSGSALLSPSKMQCPTQLGWGGIASGTGSANDQGVNGVCGDGDTLSVTGSGAGYGPVQITIDAAQNSYTFSPYLDVFAAWSWGATLCGPGWSFNQPILITPVNPVTPGPIVPFTGLTFPLPATVGVITQSNLSFTALSWFGVPTQFTISYTLTPILSDNDNSNVDNPCPKEGGSSIACQNQSLGEDVPIAGTVFFLHYESDRAPGASGANHIAMADAGMIGGWTLNVHHAYDPSSNTLFMGDGGQRRAWQLGSSSTYGGNLLVASKDGSEVYVFSSAGRHLKTLKPLTGVPKYEFSYDAAGNLTAVTDETGNATMIHRNASEEAVGIVSPYAQATTLSMDNNNFLSQVKDPLGNAVEFGNGPTGLLLKRTDANQYVYTFVYDNTGKLTSDTDPLGGSTTLTRTNSSTGYSVGTTTSLGRTSTFVVTNSQSLGEDFANTWPNGLVATSSSTQMSGTLSEKTILPSGTTDSRIMAADPRWGLQTPVLQSEALTRGSLTMNKSATRSVALGTAGGPFSVSAQLDTTTINGRTYTSAFNALSKSYVNTTPQKRTVTTVLDSLERISSSQVGTLLPVSYSYDTYGRLSTISQGARTVNLAYDPTGFLISVTDPLKLPTTFTHDADGRLLTTTLPDGRVITLAYDANGNVTSVTPAGKSAHGFAFTAVNDVTAYTPPVISGAGASKYMYDLDRELTSITRPDGQTVKYTYDPAGRVSSTTTPNETINFAYNAITGSLSGASISTGETIAYGYNGPLPTSATWSGAMTGSVSRTYDNNFWVISEGIDNGNAINFTYDNDGLLTNAGALAVTADPSDGRVLEITLGDAKEIRTYDVFGDLATYTANFGSTVLYTVAITRDADGRVSTETETIGSKTSTFGYSYDLAGRLTGVQEDGASVSSYTYDTNSNRLTATSPQAGLAGTYDSQDRLLTYGDASFSYAANGELASQSVGLQSTSYQYDVRGNLVAATLSDGTEITYIIDPENHRVGKEVNGVLQSGFLYDGNRIVAQLNGSNAIVSQFIYASGGITPDYMVSGGINYIIISDRLGSPRLVVNTTTGAVIEQVSYDEFGTIVSDTNPGFQPFAFAGGLYDQDLELVRLGARDYSPAIGRWTTKDPILFKGGDTNLYGYVLMDPVNATDPSGRRPNPFTAIGDWYTSLRTSIQNSLDSWQSEISNFMKITPHCTCQENPGGGEGVTPGDLEWGIANHVASELAGEVVESDPLGPTMTAVEGAGKLAELRIILQQWANRIGCAGN